MQLQNHIEYQTVYLPNAAAFTRCQAAVAKWRASGTPIVVEPYDLRWTPTTVLAFIHELAALFQRYNQVLWQHFSYCRQCGGQCCVVAASDVRPFDLLAIALLDETAPRLPERIAAGAQACIYLNGQHCSWPDGWRTIKCWSFYCLGSGPWPAATPLNELYQAVTAALQQVVDEHLPAPLRHYATIHNLALGEHLDDPVAFAHLLHTALDALFVTPFNHHYPCLAPADELTPRPGADRTAGAVNPKFNLQLFDDLPDTNGLEILAALTDEVLQTAAPGSEELLADLETLAWIGESHPAQAQAVIEEMYERYAHPAAPVDPELAGPWQQMRTYLQHWSSSRRS